LTIKEVHHGRKKSEELKTSAFYEGEFHSRDGIQSYHYTPLITSNSDIDFSETAKFNNPPLDTIVEAPNVITAINIVSPRQPYKRIQVNKTPQNELEYLED